MKVWIGESAYTTEFIRVDMELVNKIALAVAKAEGSGLPVIDSIQFDAKELAASLAEERAVLVAAQNWRPTGFNTTIGAQLVFTEKAVAVLASNGIVRRSPKKVVGASLSYYRGLLLSEPFVSISVQLDDGGWVSSLRVAIPVREIGRILAL